MQLTLKASQVSLCNRRVWGGVGFRPLQTKDYYSEEKAVLFTGAHLGPRREGILGGSGG